MQIKFNATQFNVLTLVLTRRASTFVAQRIKLAIGCRFAAQLSPLGLVLNGGGSRFFIGPAGLVFLRNAKSMTVDV